MIMRMRKTIFEIFDPPNIATYIKKIESEIGLTSIFILFFSFFIKFWIKHFYDKFSHQHIIIHWNA
jgi:hypothetical protein